MDFREVVEGRRSVRSFRRDPVPRDVLEKIVRAASLAPSSFNLQPWHFHVATGATRDALGGILAQATVHLSEYVHLLGEERMEEANAWYSSLGDAPVVIAVSMPADGTGLEATNKLLSIGAALENLLLAVVDEGLGACSITFAWWVREELGELLGLAEGREVIAIVAVGYPEGVEAASAPRRTDVADWLD